MSLVLAPASLFVPFPPVELEVEDVGRVMGLGIEALNFNST